MKHNTFISIVDRQWIFTGVFVLIMIIITIIILPKQKISNKTANVATELKMDF